MNPEIARQIEIAQAKSTRLILAEARLEGAFKTICEDADFATALGLAQRMFQRVASICRDRGDDVGGFIG